MEEITILAIQFFLEVVLNAAVALPFDWSLGERTYRSGMGCAKPLIFLAIGVGCGFISLLVLPTLLIPLPWLRLTNLVLSPVLAGALAAYLAYLRYKDTSPTQLRAHFMNSFLFTLAYASVRLAYAR